MGSITIRIVDDDGSAVNGCQVGVSWEQGAFGGGVSSDTTDSDGWAEFDIPDHVIRRPTLEAVYVSGKEVASYLGTVSDGDTFSFTYPS